MIDSIKELEELILLLKKHDIPSFKMAGIELTFNKASNIPALEEEQPKPRKAISIFEDPDFMAHIPIRTKMRGETE